MEDHYKSEANVLAELSTEWEYTLISRPRVVETVRDELRRLNDEYDLGVPLSKVDIHVYTRPCVCTKFMSVVPYGCPLTMERLDYRRVQLHSQPDGYVLFVSERAVEMGEAEQRVLARHEMAHIYQMEQYLQTSEYDDVFTRLLERFETVSTEVSVEDVSHFASEKVAAD